MTPSPNPSNLLRNRNKAVAKSFSLATTDASAVKYRFFVPVSPHFSTG